MTIHKYGTCRICDIIYTNEGIGKSVCNKRASGWTESELSILKENYISNDKATLLRLLPNRNWSGITHKASRLNIVKRSFQKHNVWSLDNFNDGYIHGDRFIVRMPNHPRQSCGYVRRGIVAYEAYHNVIVPKDMYVHHKNSNPLDDSIENLQLVSKKEHNSIHAIANGSRFEKNCKYCDKIFGVSKSDVLSGGGKFCSRRCYNKYQRGRSKKH